MSIQKLSVPEDRSLADGEGLEPPYGSPRRLSRPMQSPFCHPSVFRQASPFFLHYWTHDLPAVLFAPFPARTDSLPV